MLGPVQVVTTSERSLDLPGASQRRLPGTEFAEDAVIDMAEIPERGSAGEPQEHAARRDPPRHDLTPAAMTITARRRNAQPTLAGFAASSVT